jgi:hypothetical protein
MRDELTETTPYALLLVSDKAGNPVRWIKGASTKGLHRTNWDLRRPAPNPIRLTRPAFTPPWAGEAEGPLAAPGEYNVQLYVLNNGELEAQGDPQTFQVKPVLNTEMETDFQAVSAFQAQTSELLRQTSSASQQLSAISERLRYIDAAILKIPKASAEHFATLQELKEELMALRMRLSGDPIRQQFSESTSPSIAGRVGDIVYGHWNTRQLPTQTFRDNLELAKADFEEFKSDLKGYLSSLETFEVELEEAGAPFTKGRRF